MTSFKVTVIIPVYNAVRYIQQAVESAVGLEEVGEVILVDDGYPDGALEVCHKLQSSYPIVKILRHPNGANMGAGASRNLGVANAQFDFIAFLDADDWYLTNRFREARRIFSESDDVDGVYEATGFFYEQSGRIDPGKLTTLKRNVGPGDLLYNLLIDGGRFTTDAITVRKDIFQRTGFFDTSLRLHQDTHLWLRFAHSGRLVSGQLNEAVAIRRVHDENRIQHQNPKSRRLLYEKTFEWFENQKNVDPRVYRILFKRYVSTRSESRTGKYYFLLSYFLSHPTKILKFF